MKEDLFNDVMKRFLEGQATAHEKEMLSSWLKQDPGHGETFYLHLFKRESDCPQYLPEVDSKFEAYTEFLNGGKRIPAANPRHLDPSPFRPPTLRYWWAASVLVMLSMSFYFLSDTFKYEVYRAEEGTIRSFVLEDGSSITLNANSSFKIPRNFLSGKTREVWIDGEAFFDVAKTTDGKRFIVHTKNVDVEVLGTRFNVNDRRGKTEVVLTEGKVKLVSKDQEPVIMEPGEKVTVSDDKSQFQKQAADLVKYEAWRKNMLVFENTPLSDVVQTIHDYYGVELRISDPALSTRQFTGTLPNNDLDVILLSLSTAYNIEIERKNEVIMLR